MSRRICAAPVLESNRNQTPEVGRDPCNRETARCACQEGDTDRSARTSPVRCHQREWTLRTGSRRKVTPQGWWEPVSRRTRCFSSSSNYARSSTGMIWCSGCVRRCVKHLVTTGFWQIQERTQLSTQIIWGLYFLKQKSAVSSCVPRAQTSRDSNQVLVRWIKQMPW